jgi:hypothetical protein
MPKKHREICTLKGERKTSVSNGEKNSFRKKYRCQIAANAKSISLCMPNKNVTASYTHKFNAVYLYISANVFLNIFWLIFLQKKS